MFRALVLMVVSLALSGALAGCASTTLSSDECRAADWRAKGVEDGRAGQPAAYFARYVEECAGVASPDRAAWTLGRGEGLLTHCTPAGAYAAGREGRAYSGVCPDPVDPEILEASQHGLTWRKMKDRIADLERLESGFGRGCTTGLGMGGSFNRCGYGSGIYAGTPGSGWDPRVEAELRQLRRDIIPYASWPPPGGEVIGAF